MKKKFPKVSIIVFNYNGKKLLERFLPSLRKLKYDNYEVIILDNASTDCSADFVRKNFPKFKIIENKENMGTAGGSNVSAKFSNGKYILWLGNDMEVHPNLLRELVKVAESNSNVGIVGCKVLRLDSNENKTSIIDTIGADIDLFGFPRPRGHDEVDKGQWDYITDVFMTYGCSMLINRQVFEKIGGFDPLYFTLTDDLDLCWRIQLSGYRVVVAPSAVIYHKVSSTIGTTFKRSQTRHLSERNFIRTIIKNYSKSTLLTLFPAYFMLLIMESLFYLLIRKKQLFLAISWAISWNIKNFKSAWTLHKKIQHQRKISEYYIWKKTLKTIHKFELLQKYFKGEFRF